MDNLRSRNWVMVLYPDDPSHMECLSILEKSGYNYAAILHCEDVYDEHDTDDSEKIGTKKKDHFHVVLSLKNPRFRDPLADELGIKPNYLEVCRNRDSALLYLVHDGFPNKYQYDPANAFGPLALAINKLLVDESESARVLKVLDVLDTMPVPTSYRAFLTRCCELELYGDFRRLGSGILRLLDEHNTSFYEEKQRKTELHNSRTRVRPYVDSIDPFDALPRLERHGMLKLDGEL